MIPYLRMTHSTYRYPDGKGGWVYYEIKSLRQVNLQIMRTGKMRDVIKKAGLHTKIY